MGQLMVKLAEPLQQCGGSVVKMLGVSRKRKRTLDPDSSSEELENESLSPKKKKLLTTTQYIYQALFKEQKNSDVAVMVLGKVWNLHKVYLSQSPYFYSMFNGSWKESCQDFVHIKILDDRITQNSLDAVFGSMYSDEIEIDPKEVISMLATATLFQLDGVIEKCAEVMVENINVVTVIGYYDASCQYGTMSVKKATFEWLETNLLSIYTKHLQLLRPISIELMTALISSPNLYVMQTEFSLYTMLCTWIYLRLHPNHDLDLTPQKQQQAQQLQQSQQQEFYDPDYGTDVVQTYFMNRTENRAFLATPEGRAYLAPFQALRTQYLTNHRMDLKIILKSNIIPKEWLHNHVLSHWSSILNIDHSPEEGPQNLDPAEFFQNCMRCGRIILESGYQKWRWTGFNYGLDLVLIADERTLSIRRHHRNEHERLLSLQTKRQFMIRASVTSINSQRQPIFTQKSDVISLSLEKNQEVNLLTIDAKVVYPLLLSVNLLTVPPTNQAFKANTLSCEEANVTIPISEIGATCEERPTTPEIPAATASDDSAVCLAPPTPPAEVPVPRQHVLSPYRRSPSRTSIVSTSSSASNSSASSVASAALDIL